MKVRKQKLLSMLLCAALTVTSILSDSFFVSASELQSEQQTVVEDGTAAESEMTEPQSSEAETEGNILQEETDSTTDSAENGKSEEPETGTGAEETTAEGTATEEEKETETTADEEETLPEETDTADLETSEEAQTDPSELEEELTEEAALDAAAEDIASGSYQDIEWVIDANGKLTVTGTGDFSGASGSDRAPWYENRESITSAEINVTGMTDASYMFSGCNSLRSLNLENFDTSQVTNMRYMFESCYNLKSVDLSNFNTENVTDMRCMFEWCNNLQSLDLSNFNTRNVTDMCGMFYTCRDLQSVDVSSFDTSNVTNMGSMFIGCGSLQSVDVSNFETKNVTVMAGMFYKCSSLQNIDVRNFDTGNVTDMSGMFSECSSLQSINVSNFDASNVTDIGIMFSGCSNLQSIDISNFDTQNVTNMNGMFSGCSNLQSVDVSSFNTENVTRMDYMFYKCSSLQSIDVSSFDTGNVEMMSSMFEGCSSLTDIDVSGFNTQKVTKIHSMFSNCSQLTSLDLSSFDTSNVEITDEYGISDIISGCDSLTTLYIPRNLPDQITLPEGTWYTADGSTITELPLQADYSMMITKDKDSVTSEPTITATKTKTTYGRGETLNIDDIEVTHYSTDGVIQKITDYTTNAEKIDMLTAGTKTLTITYDDLTTEVPITVKQEYIVTFNMNGHGTQIAPLTGIASDSLIDAPTPPTAKDWEFLGWYKDSSCKEKWDFKTDTVKADITLYANWHSLVYTQSGNLLIQKIPAVSYTGSELKPTVTVYYQTEDGQKKLSAGKDYTIKYFNNIQADKESEKELGGTGVSEKDSSNGFTKNLAYVVITCKGNYNGTVYQNFHINTTSVGSGNSVTKGFTLKYSEQIAKSDQPLKPFTSLKYKKAMKAGVDYRVILSTIDAYNAKRIKLAKDVVLDAKSDIPSIPAGYYGTFLMTVTGIGNYTGSFTKVIYVAGKDYLMKNATVMVGKNQKSVKYTGSEISLNPGWYDVSEWKYYYVTAGSKPEKRAEKKNVFTVKVGQEYLLYGEDFEVSYSNNLAVGTATMTITGIGDYIGTKKVTFRITGTEFNAKNINVDNLKSSMVYNGYAQTQDQVTLTDVSWKKSIELFYGQDYTISYKNNVKAGTATIIFTGKPESGYSGSFKKTFQITPVGIRNRVSGSTANPLDSVIDIQANAGTGNSGDMKFNGSVIYTKTGAKISGRVKLTDKYTKHVLKEGTDYTVSYSSNKKVTTQDELAVMKVTGMGDYKGSINIYFPIEPAPLSDNANLKVTASEISYNAKKAQTAKYRPKIKITDNKKSLSATKDFEVVEYINCSQEEVTSYLEALADGTAQAGERPYAVVEAREGSNYTGSMEVDLTIYQKKLSANNLYVIVSQEPEQITYTGRQVRPEVTVYFGNAKAVKKAKAAKETDESSLTDPDGKYRLKELTKKEGWAGDYTLTYGSNITAGKNKGSVTVIGTGMYSGKVAVKFTVLKKTVNDTRGKASKKSTVSVACAPGKPDEAGIMNVDILFSNLPKRYCS